MFKSEIIMRLSSVLTRLFEFGLVVRLAHWNVTGPNFSSLHELFDSIYTANDKNIDLVAERIRYLESKVTYGQPLIAVHPSSDSNEKVCLDTLIKNSQDLSSFLTENITYDGLDHSSQDMLIDIQRELDNYIYHLRSHRE